MKIIIAGGREFNDYKLLKDKCEELTKNLDNLEIISGTANGADRLGERYAKEKGLPLHLHPADWDTYGKSAGYIRNTEMADKAEYLIAFWNGTSKGTKHMIDIATNKGLKVRVVKV